MTDRWSRRTILAGVGMLALAGCTSDTGQTGTDAAGTRTTSAPEEPSSETPSPTEHGEETESPEPAPEPPSGFESTWPAPAADAGRSNYAAGAAGPTERVAELWRLVADTTFSTPVFADETLFVAGGDGRVRALDARSGEERWQQEVGTSARTPWVFGDSLFVPTGEALVRLRRSDGSESWRVQTPDRAAVLVASHGVYWIAEEDPAVVALARTDGTERWRTPIDEPWEPPLFASERSVFVSSGTRDSRFWTLSGDTGDVLGDEPRRGDDFPVEQFYTGGTVYAVDAFFGNVYATGVGENGSGWSQGVSPGGGAGGGLLSGGADRIYYTSNAEDEPTVRALSKTDGAVNWTATLDATITGRPVVAGETVLVPTEGGVRCLDPASGAERWARSDVGSRLIVVDDLVYASGDGEVRAFRPP